jgi:exodeoxyribonuclease VII large subunit
VQGVDAPAEIIRALGWAYADAQQQKIDVILLVRGGGSIEDLWAFNDEALARYVAQAPVPVVSGVGHETDFTIADFVADHRAPTPTGAAELATPNRQALLEQLGVLQDRLLSKLTQRLERESQRLDQLTLRLAHAIPDPKRMREKKEQLKIRLLQAWHMTMHRQRQLVLSQHQQLEALNPQRTLERGYAVLMNSKDQVVMSSEAIAEQDTLHVRLAKGQVTLQVEKLKS